MFAEGGYTTVRDRIGGRIMHLVVDHGPLGYLAIAAHGHADALSLTLSLDGEAIIVDPGTYLYHAGAEWRDWLRGTRAHNTVAMAGRDQSTIAGAFNWSHKAAARVIDFKQDGDWRLVAAHDGYRKAFGLDHERAIERLPDGIRILDRAVGGRAVEAEITWQLAAGLVATRGPDGLGIEKDGRTLAEMIVRGEGEIATFEGEEPGQGGWISRGFGHKEPATRIVWRGRLGSEPVETVIRWS